MIQSLEKELLSTSNDLNNANCIFILGSPRTGSTILYQAVLDAFQTGFIANITNDYFASTPAIGFSLQHSAEHVSKVHIVSASTYGKTKGLYQPSEGSAVMQNWFGGGHPSQTKSTTFVSESQALHMLQTINYANALFKAPLVIKNAWNCFRIKALAKLMPRAYFIWIRRDIRASAKSDLAARYTVQKDPNTWNSATPANVEALMKRSYVEQVVENQFEFNQAIGRQLSSFVPSRYSEVWYEDLCQNPIAALLNIYQQCDLLHCGQEPKFSEHFSIQVSTRALSLPENESLQIDNFVAQNISRLKTYCFQGAVHETA